jgi:hypothetical protein
MFINWYRVLEWASISAPPELSVQLHTEFKHFQTRCWDAHDKEEQELMQCDAVAEEIPKPPEVEQDDWDTIQAELDAELDRRQRECALEFGAE